MGFFEREESTLSEVGVGPSIVTAASAPTWAFSPFGEYCPESAAGGLVEAFVDAGVGSSEVGEPASEHLVEFANDAWQTGPVGSFGVLADRFFDFVETFGSDESKNFVDASFLVTVLFQSVAKKVDVVARLP